MCFSIQELLVPVVGVPVQGLLHVGLVVLDHQALISHLQIVGASCLPVKGIIQLMQFLIDRSVAYKIHRLQFNSSLFIPTRNNIFILEFSAKQ